MATRVMKAPKTIDTREKKNRKLPDGIELMHFEQFLKELWSGRLIRFK